jgi:hypothetical protein
LISVRGTKSFSTPSIMIQADPRRGSP